jgi:hypothetical protein
MEEVPMDEFTPAVQPHLDPLLEERLLDLGALVMLLQEQITQVHATCEAALAAVERCTAHQAEQTAAGHQLHARLDALQASVQTLTPVATRSGWPRWLPRGRHPRERERYKTPPAPHP